MKKNTNDRRPVTGSATGSEWDKNREASERGLIGRETSGDARTAGPNDEAQRAEQPDEGQGSAGIQGQYAGHNDQPSDERKGKTAPHRPDPDTMNQNGSMHVALGKRKPYEHK
jgi:hypothetical protein